MANLREITTERTHKNVDKLAKMSVPVNQIEET